MQNFAELVMSADTRGLLQADRDQEKLVRSGKKLEDQTGRTEASLTRMGGAAKSAGLAIAAGLAAMASFGAVVQQIRQFESSMSKLSAITGATTTELSQMRDVARDLGATTEFSATQAADGLTFLGMAGFSAAESIAAIPAVLDLATASGMGLAEAADTASNIMSGFGIAADNAADVADVLAAAASRANTDVGQLGQAMSTVAPISAALGIDLADTAASIGVLSDAGIQGARAGTAMRGVLAALAGPTTEARDILADLGLTISDIDPATNDLADVMDRLAASGITTADAMKVFGREAASGALVLIDGANRLREFGGELRNVDGAASDMADTMRDNLGGDIDGLQSAISGLIISLGDAGLTAVLRTVIQGITEFVRGVSAIVGAIGSASDAVAGFVSDILGVASSEDQLAASMALAETAIDNSTIAMGDQIRQSAILAARISDGNVMTIEAARVNLESAKARLSDVAAMREQNELAARQQLGVDDAFMKVQQAREALSQARNNLTAEDIQYMEEYGEAYTSMTASLYRELESELANRLSEQKAISEAFAGMQFLTPEQQAQQEQTRQNIAALELGIEGAKNGLVAFNGGVTEGVELTERLNAAVANMPDNLIAASNAMADIERSLGSGISGFNENIAETNAIIALMEGGLNAAQIQAVQLAGIDLATAPANAVVKAIRLADMLGVSVTRGFEIAGAIGSIDFSSAVAGAQALSAQLGVSLQSAMQMMGLLGAAAQAANDAIIYDPRDPRYDPDLAAQGANLERISGIMDNIEYNIPSVPSIVGTGSSLGGGGGRSSGGGGASSVVADLQRQADQAADAYDRLIGQIDPAVEAAQRYAEQQEIVNEALRTGHITADQARLTMEALDAQMQAAEWEDLNAKIEDFAGSLADAIVAGENLGDVFVNQIKRMAAELISSGLTTLMQQAFGMGSAGGGILGGLLGGGGFAKGGGGVFGGFKAAGGPVSSGKSYIVGEEGPELFRPGASGMITPNHALGGGGAGGSITLNVNSDPAVIVQIAENTTGAAIKQNNRAINDGFNQRTNAYTTDPRRRGAQ